MMKPYPAYKESGVEWLGEIPEQWKPGRLKFLAQINPSKNGDLSKDSEDLVTFLPMENVSENGEIITEVKKSISELWSGFTYFEENDVILAKITPCFENGKGAHLSDLGSKVGFGSTEFHVLRAIKGKSSARFLFYLTRTDVFRSTGEAFMTGSAGQKRVPTSFVEDFWLGIPSPEEQQAIADYLDRKTAVIDTLIAKKERQIALLQEQRTAVINTAVTKGLNPDAPLKDSGIPWIDQIPAHWNTIRFKFLVEEGVAGPYGSSLTKAMYTTEGYRVYGQQQVIPDNFKVGDYYISQEKFEKMRRYEVEPGDILISVMGTVGRVAVVPNDVEPGIINPRLVKYKLKKATAYPRYVQMAMLSDYCQSQMLLEAKGATMDGLNMQILGEIKIALPPIDEQRQILSRVNIETSKIDIAAAKYRNNIELLYEYRTAVISAAVTGKIDVREAS